MGDTFEVAVLPLTWSDLHQIPIEQKSLYVTLCFLVSELNALQRLLLLSFKVFVDNPVYEAAARIQSNVLIRTYSSKCFEVRRFIRSSYEKTTDPTVKALASNYLERSEFTDTGKGFAIASHVRDKMAFHLDFGQAVKSTRRVAAEVDCGIYLHQNDGNCFFPLGDHIIQELALLEAAGDAKFAIRSEKDHEDWVEWARAVHASTKDMHMDVFERLILPHVSGSLGAPTYHNIELSHVADMDRDSLPLFLGRTQ